MDDFTGIVHNVFLELYTELNLESIELFQMNDEQYGHIVCALPEKKIQEQTINSLYGFLKGKTFKLPVFIRDRAAMYVAVVKDNMTDEDKIEFTEKILILQNVAAVGNFSDSIAASYKVMEDALDRVPVGVAVLDNESRRVLLLNSVAARSESVQSIMGKALKLYTDTGKQTLEDIYDNSSGLWYDVNFSSLKWINGEDVLVCTTIDVTQKIRNRQKIEYQANNDYLTGLFNRMKCERDLDEILKNMNPGEKGCVVFLDLDNFKQVNDGLGHQYGDVTQKIRNRQKIEYQANNDYLTGLFNRMKCERDLDEILKNMNPGEKGCVVFLDLDNFKQVNDGLGHQYGDVLLQEIAYSLQETDGIKNSCYRMGGDEFVIIVKPWYFDKITEIVDKISKRFNDIWHIMDVDYYCTMSMGIAVFPDQGKTVDELIKKADFAMYEAKKGGKNRFLWYTVEDEERKCADNGFRDSIKELVGDDCRDFDINYQPVFDKDGILYGAEALVRINSGSLGRLLPAEFLPTAEYLGIMNRIGHYVFAKAVKTLKKWNGTHPDLKMFINMAPTQLMMPKAAENIMNIVKQWEVNPGNIYCDISEKTEFLDEKMALATLEILNEHGINISLDDFGSGKMSLGFLKDSHASMIKFNNSLVKKSRTDDVEITILRSITEIADILDIDIAFVGIEDDNDNNMALENKADYLGGFYYGEALPEDEFETKWLK